MTKYLTGRDSNTECLGYKPQQSKLDRAMIGPVFKVAPWDDINCGI